MMQVFQLGSFSAHYLDPSEAVSWSNRSPSGDSIPAHRPGAQWERARQYSREQATLITLIIFIAVAAQASAYRETKAFERKLGTATQAAFTEHCLDEMA